MDDQTPETPESSEAMDLLREVIQTITDKLMLELTKSPTDSGYK